jgi:hypothetical protein
MKMEKLERIPVDFDLDSMLGHLRLSGDGAKSKEFAELLEQAAEIATPKVLYAVSYIEAKARDSVRFGGETFTSRVLRVNLEDVERVFPYIATCGSELDSIDTEYDMLKQYWLDEIKSKALLAAMQHLYTHIDEHHRPGKLSTMNPGSSAAGVWPIEQQRELFAIFGDVEASIGVRLTDSCLMIPNKTVSGVFFATNGSFESCQLCPREKCKGRRAPYDPESVVKYAEEN